MPLPRPSSPRVLLQDLRAFAAERRPHQWLAAGVAILMPIGIIILFITDGRTNIMPGEQIVYVDSWRADRTDAEIKAQQKKDQAELDAARKERQRQFQKLDKDLDRLGI
ncbi:MAG: hypothetical protein E6G94_06505 [Alphaproteobacteria bacterium]|nr:MAG: hypothetical protein E6G94_06505 [Alphaproteobacteria bacterium]